MTPVFIKRIKQVLKWLATLMAGLLALLFLLGFFYGSDVKKLVIAELNKHLAAEIIVRDFDLSFVRHFPFAAVEMKEVLIHEVGITDTKDTLLAADRISLLFSVWDLFSKEIEVKKILLKDGQANLRIDAKGNNNYEFWKSAGDNSTSSTTLNLRLIGLENIRIQYHNLRDEQNYFLLAEKAALSGKFSDSEFSLNTEAKLFIHHFYAGKINYINQKNVMLLSTMEVNTISGIYSFGKSDIKIGQLNFEVIGNVKDEDQFSRLDLTVKSGEAELTDFISLLPLEFISYLKDFESRGKFNFTARMEGLAGNGKIPSIEIQFGFKNGEIRPKGSTVALSSLQMEGNYKNFGKNTKSELRIPQLKATLGGHPLQAKLSLEDLENPFLQLNVQANLDLAELRHFLKIDTLERLQGDMTMDISFAGKIKSLKEEARTAALQIRSSGIVNFSNVGFALKNNPLEFKNIGGKITLNNNDVLIEGFRGNISASDIQLDGSFKNFINFLFIPDQATEMRAKMNSKLINLDELLADKSSVSDEDTSYIMKFNPRLVAKLDVTIGRIQFRKFSATRIQGKINLEKQVISGRGLTFSAMDGMVYMDAMINASRKDSVLMRCDAKISKLDIIRVFSELENFGQSTLTDKNVRGKVSADVQFVSSWSNSLSIDMKKVKSYCDITIEDGELLSFLPIQALARYLKVPDLNHIRFSTLRNSISIADRKISFPVMEINSTALNLTASGTHDFDNNVDYKLRLLLSDVLGKKARQNNTEFGEIEDDGLGRTRLFLAMKGPVDNPRFSYDRKAAGEKIKEDFVKGKQTFKSIIKEEFGKSSKEEPKQVQKKKKEELEIDWDSPD